MFVVLDQHLPDMGGGMSQWKELLEQTLAPGDASVSALDAGARDTAQLIISEASDSGEAEALLQELLATYPYRHPEKGLSPLRAYLTGRVLLDLERYEEAMQALLPLCEKLEQAAQWTELAQVADEVLQAKVNIDAARYLAKAIEEGGPEIVPDGSLTRAMDAFPDEPRICWLMAEQTEREGDTERAQALFASCLPALIDSKSYDRVEEVFVRLDDCQDLKTTQVMLLAGVKLAAAKEWQLAETYLESLLPRIKEQDLAEDAWNMFLKLLPRAPETSALRKFLMEIAPAALPSVDGVLDLLARSGLMEPSTKAETAIKRLEELLEFAPGYRVLHNNWGAGRIRAVEENALIIDFKDKPGHRMSLAISRKSLKVIPPDDLRVLWAENPDQVKEMARKDRPGLAYLAIRELGGKVTTQDMRRRLTPEIITTSSWSTWWKDARLAMEEDERFDFSESFRQTYRIRSKDDADQALIFPRLDRRRGIRANLNLLRRFLDQHPTRTEQAVKMYTPVLTRWLRDEHTNAEASVAICLLLHKWNRLEEKDLEVSLRALLQSGIEAAVFADEEAQRFLATRGLELEGLRREAIFFALGSRYRAIREIGLEELRSDPHEAQRIITELLSHPEDRPNTALTLIVTIIDPESEKESFSPSVWRCAASLCRLIERIGRDALRTQVMRLFARNGQLAQVLAKTPMPEDISFHLEDTLRRWRESENYLFPILDFFESVGQADLVATVRGDRVSATNRALTLKQTASGYDGYYLTRNTIARLEEERAFLSRELKTTVAQALQTAREMGDLSENAEYDAAKEKHASFMNRIQQITEVLSSATMIENVSVPEGEIGPGSRVEVKVKSGEGAPSGEHLIFWLLGEGDSRFGAEVVSSMAPAAQPLLGRRVGDEVVLPMAEGSITAEIISSERRLPADEPLEKQT